MQLDIGSILANLVMAATVYTLLNSQLEYLKSQLDTRDKRIKELEDENQQLQEDHKNDLRKWSGINQGAIGIEDDTRRLRLEEGKQRRLREAEERRRQLEDDASTD